MSYSASYPYLILMIYKKKSLVANEKSNITNPIPYSLPYTDTDRHSDALCLSEHSETFCEYSP